MQTDPELKHRHDVGHPEHGAPQVEGVTKTIQVLLGLTIVATVLLTAYALVMVGMSLP